MQVNPGETFTIRAEDGSLQCIQGMLCLLSYSCYVLPTQKVVGFLDSARCEIVSLHGVCLGNWEHDWCGAGFGAGVNR